MNLSTLFVRKLVEFMLLNGYSLDRPGLVCGKAGVSLSLFEAARFLEDESIETYAFDLFKEVLAWNTEKYNFDSGKAGIAWTLLYLINNQLIDANYRELCGDEHQLIIDYLKELEANQVNIESCVGYLMYLFAAKEEILASDFDIIQRILLTAAGDYYSKAPYTPTERERFYLNSLKLLGLYNSNEQARPYLSKIGFIVSDLYKMISGDYYSCNNSLFGLNLFVYGLLSGKRDIMLSAESVINIILANTIKEALSLKQIVDLSYVMEQLTFAGKDMHPFARIYQLIDSVLIDEELFKKGSIFYKMKFESLFSLSGGIPRLMWICMDSAKLWQAEKKKIVMLL